MKFNAFTKALALLLVFTMLFLLPACSPAGDGPETTTDGETTTGGAPDETTAPPSVDSSLPIKVTVLNGTTGFGMAKLIKDKADGKASLNYTFDVQADPSLVTKALINGSTDIAALPTNAAATVFNKTNGGVQVLALNTLGVLYVIANGEANAVSSFEELRGKTVYCPANNPEVIFRALCEANGLTVGTDITIDTTYAEPAALRNAAVAGEVALAVLPEPMVTIAKKQNTALLTALDLTAEWDKKFPAGSLVQGCVVVRTAFAEAHPAEVAAFLTEYAKSIAFLSENPSEAGAVVVESGVFAGQAPIAAAAIPNCNVTFVAGAEMKAALSTFLTTLHGIAPTSIGGSIPTDSFYYVP